VQDSFPSGESFWKLEFPFLFFLVNQLQAGVVWFCLFTPFSPTKQPSRVGSPLLQISFKHFMCPSSVDRLDLIPSFPDPLLWSADFPMIG